MNFNPYFMPVKNSLDLVFEWPTRVLKVTGISIRRKLFSMDNIVK